MCTKLKNKTRDRHTKQTSDLNMSRFFKSKASGLCPPPQASAPSDSPGPQGKGKEKGSSCGGERAADSARPLLGGGTGSPPNFTARRENHGRIGMPVLSVNKVECTQVTQQSGLRPRVCHVLVITLSVTASHGGKVRGCQRHHCFQSPSPIAWRSAGQLT